MIGRRKFLQATSAGAGSLLLASEASASAAPKSIRIKTPFHGAVLNRRHGGEVDGGLCIPVSGTAPVDVAVSVNGSKAMREGTAFSTEIVLRDKETDIVATIQGTSETGERTDRPLRWRRSLFGTDKSPLCDVSGISFQTAL